MNAQNTHSCSKFLSSNSSSQIQDDMSSCKVFWPSAPLLPLLESSNTPAGWQELQSPSNQAFLTRCLAGILEVDDVRQQAILTICRRALHPSHLPLWPADALLKQESTSRQAARLVECMPFADAAALLPTLVTLPWAADIVNDLSDHERFADRVAAAVMCVEYRPYMRMLGLPALWRLVPYLRENDAVFALRRLVVADRCRALRLGAVTHLIACGHNMDSIALMPPGVAGVHAAVHFMYTTGCPAYVEDVACKEPGAMQALMKQWPAVRQEVNWFRRRMWLMCTASIHGVAKDRFWHRVAILDAGPFRLIAGYL